MLRLGGRQRACGLAFDAGETLTGAAGIGIAWSPRPATSRIGGQAARPA
jgi:hypothetical protein